MITKREAVDMFGGQASLARELGLTRQAVWKWEWDEPIPQLQWMRLRYEICPERFASSNSPRGVWTEA